MKQLTRHNIVYAASSKGECWMNHVPNLTQKQRSNFGKLGSLQLLSIPTFW